MPTDDEQRNAIHPDTRIDIHGGIHNGAASILRGQQITVIGSAADCDLCLLDSGIAAHHLALGINNKGFVVRPMDGRCRVNGKTLRAGQSLTIAPGDRIALDESGVWLATAEVRAQANEPESGGATSSRRRLYACAVLLAIGVTVSSQRLLSTEPVTPDLTSGIERILETLELANDITLSSQAGTVTVRGIVPDEKSAVFEHSLFALSGNIANRTQSAGRLLEQVSSVFRTNGYHAELEYLGKGAVQVSNLDGENPGIRRVAGRTRDDVPALSSLTFLPVSDADRSGRQLALYSTDPDKRLTTIVDGDTAYVATTDGGRYFVGSVLPGGLVLREISADGIQVDDNGEIHWLAL